MICEISIELILGLLAKLPLRSRILSEYIDLIVDYGSRLRLYATVGHSNRPSLFDWLSDDIKRLKVEDLLVIKSICAIDYIIDFESGFSVCFVSHVLPFFGIQRHLPAVIASKVKWNDSSYTKSRPGLDETTEATSSESTSVQKLTLTASEENPKL